MLDVHATAPSTVLAPLAQRLRAGHRPRLTFERIQVMLQVQNLFALTITAWMHSHQPILNKPQKEGSCMNDALAPIRNLPRLRLAHLPTPLEAMPRLAAELGIKSLWVKRDDCTGLGMGGSKVRKLEFSLAAAQAAGADCVVC